MKLYTAPEAVPYGLDQFASVFLAGSIEMGKASNWQLKAIDAISDLQVAVFNPRRKDWDSSWEQSIDNPQFAEQVNWELDNLYRSNVQFFYFEPGTMSPITLMELGYVLGTEEHLNANTTIIVVCPLGFWRKGNVDIMCVRAMEHMNVHLFDELDEALELLRESVQKILTEYGQ